MIVDVHAHAASEDFIRTTAAEPSYGMPYEVRPDGSYATRGYGQMDRLMWDLEGRLERLERSGIDLQLVSPSPRAISGHGHVIGVEVSRLMNRETAKLVKHGGGRLAGLGVVPLGEPRSAAAELRGAIAEYGFQGVCLPTSAGGKPLDLPEFAAVWDALDELGVLVFMHATTAITRETLGKYSLNTVIAWPTEVTVAAARLIFSGVMERHPGLQLVLSHGGGTLPFLAGRLDLAYHAPRHEANPACRANISKPPSQYLRHFYYDTVVASPASLRLLIDLVGAERVMFGTDFPYEIGDADGAIARPVIEQLPSSQCERILGQNARDILTRARCA
ncbi:MAG TPA: amidohydrolase family protein [Xanthobacteraceae bacterium]|jgi:aminocarboxymuconate-semialdehyde decarboxylase